MWPLEENSFIHKKVYVRAAQSNRKACKLLDRTMIWDYRSSEFSHSLQRMTSRLQANTLIHMGAT